MISAIVGVSLLLFLTGFVVTEKTAKYLLAGYNTLSDEGKGKIDLKSYLQIFKRFHLALSISLLTIGLILTLCVNEGIAGVFIGVYPVLAYIYLIWSTAIK